MTIPIERRRELAESTHITLNGVRAVVCGIQNDYATVAQLPNGERCDFAWPTVERIITNYNGDFVS